MSAVRCTYFFSLHMRTISPEGASSFSFFFLKLGERIQMFKVLGCYSADKAAQPTANSNFITNELSLFSQKDRNPICFFIITCCFLGGVSATNNKNIFRCSTVQPGSFSHESWITLALCPVNGSSAPRCVFMSHVSSAEFCDSNVVRRGVSLRGLSTVKSSSWESFVGAKLSYPYINSVSAFDSLFFLTSQLPAHPLGRPCGLCYVIVNLLLKSGSAEISCFYFEHFIS